MKTNTIITDISHEDLVNLISTAAYGSMWLGVDYDSEKYNALKSASQDDCLEDKMAKLLLANESIVFADLLAEDEQEYYGELPHHWDDDFGGIEYTITLKDIINGIQIALDSQNVYERECARCLIDDSGYELDQPKAELLCQLIMFGEQVY